MLQRYLIFASKLHPLRRVEDLGAGRISDFVTYYVWYGEADSAG